MLIEMKRVVAILPCLKFKNEILLSLPKDLRGKPKKWSHICHRWNKELNGIMDNPKCNVPFNVVAKYMNPLAFQKWTEKNRHQIFATASILPRDYKKITTKKG